MNKPIDTNNAPVPSKVELLRISFDQLGYQQLNNVKCEVDGNDLILSGQLKSFYLKQIAQSVAIKIPGVESVQNRIEVE